MDRQVTRLAPHFIPARGAVGFLDPPDHTRLRRSVAAAFTARGVERVREQSRGMLDELVDAMLKAGPPADLTEAVLSPLPHRGDLRADGASRPPTGTACTPGPS